MITCVGCPGRFALLVGMVGLIGCSGGNGSGTPEPAEDRLLQIGNAYVNAAHRLGHPPRNMGEIRPSFAANFTEDLLRSPRDGEPFVILWDVDCDKIQSGPNPFLISAYEKKGVDGTRYVLRFPKSVVLLTDEKFHEAVFPPGHKPPE